MEQLFRGAHWEPIHEQDLLCDLSIRHSIAQEVKPEIQTSLGPPGKANSLLGNGVFGMLSAL